MRWRVTITQGFAKYYLKYVWQSQDSYQASPKVLGPGPPRKLYFYRPIGMGSSIKGLFSDIYNPKINYSVC